MKVQPWLGLRVRRRAGRLGLVVFVLDSRQPGRVATRTTTHLELPLSSSALAEGARGGRTTLVGQLAKAVVQLLAVVVLSRLLSPDDFGLIAMVTVIISLGDLLRDFGLSTSGLRVRTLTNTQASNLFWANAVLGFFAAVLVVLLTPLLVVVYGEPRLWAITPALATSLLLNGVQSQFQVKLSRDHRYTTLAFTDLMSQAIAFVAAAAGAMAGWGYWALVAQVIVNTVSLLVSRAVILGWLPQKPSRNSGSRALLMSGADFGSAHFLQFMASNTDTVMIGAVWGATSLGYYNRAFQLLTQPAGRLLAPLMNVVIPTINAAKDRAEDVLHHYLEIQRLIGIMIILVFAVAAASASSLIPYFLGAQWEQSVPIFQILALGGAAQGLSQVSYWIFITEGKSRELLKYNVITKLATVLAVALATLVSVYGTALAYSLSLVISWPISVLWLQRTAGFPAREFLANGARALSIGVVSTLATLVSPIGSLGFPLPATMAIQILSTSGLFLALSFASKAGREDLRRVATLTKRILTAGTP